jgi:hypothetical protein
VVSGFRFWRDVAGSVLVEYTIVFPVFILLTLGTVDAAWLLADWATANKAAYRGARAAIVTDPVAVGITDPRGNIGNWCFNYNTGSPISANCPSLTTTCTGGNTTCSDGSTLDNTKFTNNIVRQMQPLFCPTLPSPYTNCRLQLQNVVINYQTTGYGYAGQPGGLPMTVKVSLRCMTHEFHFFGGLMHWIFTVPPGCPANTRPGPLMNFATSLTGEDMETN